MGVTPLYTDVAPFYTGVAPWYIGVAPLYVRLHHSKRMLHKGSGPFISLHVCFIMVNRQCTIVHRCCIMLLGCCTTVYRCCTIIRQCCTMVIFIGNTLLCSNLGFIEDSLGKSPYFDKFWANFYRIEILLEPEINPSVRPPSFDISMTWIQLPCVFVLTSFLAYRKARFYSIFRLKKLNQTNFSSIKTTSLVQFRPWLRACFT